MPIDTTTLLIGGALLLLVIWLIGLIKRIGGCLIHTLVVGAGLLLIYALYTGRIVLPL